MMEIIFATVAGLRGSVSLIMAQALATDERARPEVDPDSGIPAVSPPHALLRSAWQSGKCAVSVQHSSACALQHAACTQGPRGQGSRPSSLAARCAQG